MTLPIIYGQRDPAWKNEKLGTSSVTIGGFGCAITSIAMLLEYCGIHVTPPQLNIWLTNNKGYSGGNLIVWSAIDRFTGQKVTYQKSSATTTTYPCIAEVDLVPTNSQFDQHFVVALDDKMCADPWEKRVRPLSDFNGVKSFRIYKLEVNVSDTTELEKKLSEAIKKEAATWDLLKNGLLDPLKQLYGLKDEDVTKARDRVLEASKGNLTLYENQVNDNRDLITEIESLESVISVQGEKILNMTKQLSGQPLVEPKGALAYLTLALQAALNGKWN